MVRPGSIILFILLCISVEIHAQEAVPPDSAGIVLVVNACDPGAFHARKKKESLFVEIADSLKNYIADQLQTRYGFTARIIDLPIPDNGNRSTVTDSLIRTYQAGYLVLFDTLDVYFQQTHVDVSGTKGNKERVAYYDICADIHYCLFAPGKLLQADLNKTRDFFTSRKVISGLLAAGPDIVGKKKDAFRMADNNAHGFLWKVGSLLSGGN
jgi:hypothetical protein